MTAIPQEILDIQQWTHSWGVNENGSAGNELKRPKHTHYTPNGSLTYAQARQEQIRSGNILSIGFYVTEEDPYILGDLDHLDYPMDDDFLNSILPLEIQDLIYNKGLYTELSPSGKGIRFIAKFDSHDTKALLLKQYSKNKIDMGISLLDKDKKGLPIKREAQINIGRPWQRLTGLTMPFSSPTVGVVEIADLEPIFGIKFKAAGPVSDDAHLPYDEKDKGFPTIDEIVSLIRRLPWEGNPRLARAYKHIFGEDYTGYEYWLKVLMAVSDFISKSDHKMDYMTCLEELDSWSSKDAANYKGATEIDEKLKSFQRTENKVSYHTLFAIVDAVTLRWPIYKMPTEKQQEAGMRRPIPIITEFVNFRAMTTFYGIKLHRDKHSATKVYVSGDNDIMTRYFTHMDAENHYDKYMGPWEPEILVSKFHIMCQEQGMLGLSRQAAKQFILDALAEMNDQIDIFRMYFDMPFEKLPKRYQENKDTLTVSTPEYIFSILEIDYQTQDPVTERALYFKYYRSWLMGIVRGMHDEYREHLNNCVLLLTGPEQIYKTTHFRRLLPTFFRESQIAFTTHDFGSADAMRDVSKLAANNVSVNWDEIERYLTSATESNFKDLIDNKNTKMIDKYRVNESYVFPKAIYGGTSNQTKFNLSDHGNRRIFNIPVTRVDTDKLNTVNWHSLINGLRDEMSQAPRDQPPWLLTEGEIDLQLKLHGKVAKKNDLDMLLEEIYDFMAPFPHLDGDDLNGIQFYKYGDWRSVAELTKRLGQHTQGKYNQKRPALKNALKRLCGAWTGTERRGKTFVNPGISVRKGEVWYGDRPRFWMPPELGREEW